MKKLLLITILGILANPVVNAENNKPSSTQAQQNIPIQMQPINQQNQLNPAQLQNQSNQIQQAQRVQQVQSNRNHDIRRVEDVKDIRKAMDDYAKIYSNLYCVPL